MFYVKINVNYRLKSKVSKNLGTWKNLKKLEYNNLGLKNLEFEKVKKKPGKPAIFNNFRCYKIKF